MATSRIKMSPAQQRLRGRNLLVHIPPLQFSREMRGNKLVQSETQPVASTNGASWFEMFGILLPLRPRGRAGVFLWGGGAMVSPVEETGVEKSCCEIDWRHQQHFHIKVSPPQVPHPEANMLEIMFACFCFNSERWSKSKHSGGHFYPHDMQII